MATLPPTEDRRFPDRDFENLFSDCKSRGLEAIIKYEGRGEKIKPVIDILNDKGKIIDSMIVKKTENVDRAAGRLHRRMKKTRIL